jgi:diguanylate cyclase
MLTVRYHEDRERSAEILRLCLAQMGRHTAAFNPTNYAVWYEYCAGVNPKLTCALEQKLATNLPLGDEEILQLYDSHIAAREHGQSEHLRGELYRILQETASHTQTADDKSARFDQALAGHEDRLTHASDPQTVRATVMDLLGDTGKMRAMTAELSAQLAASTEEVTLLTASLRQAQTEALIDPLTGLKNRRGFERFVHELIQQTGQLEGTALLVADIDHFKEVNDRHGHLLGDKVLCAIAHVLKSHIKGRDIAARLGGEEFAVLLPQTAAAGAVALAKQICAIVSQGKIRRVVGEGTIGQVTLSIGVAVARSGELLESVLERADAALYVAKRAGRNRVELATAPE